MRASRWTLRGAVLSVLVAIAAWHLGHAAYIELKARLAQILIARAAASTAQTGVAVKPWPWADTWPVARLSVPRLGASTYVLEGSSGRSLAFAPGHVIGTALPGDTGNSVIAAHRDTHFAFLRDLRIGDDVIVDSPTGQRRRYRVTDMGVVDKRAMRVMGRDGPTRLTLITCFPFDAIAAGGPLRYVVTATAEDLTAMR